MHIYVPSLLCGAGIALAYASVLANAFGGYELPHRGTGYTESVFWLGMPSHVVRILELFQILGLLGYVAWIVEMERQFPVTLGLFATHPWILPIVNVVLLSSSALWPFLAWKMIRVERQGASSPVRGPWTWLACLSVWITAASTCVLCVGTLEASLSSPLAAIGILLFANMTVLLDGVGWAIPALHPPA